MTEHRDASSIWFFLVLTLLGVAAIVIPIVYNLTLQLTADQMEQARQLWRAAKPSDYDLDYQEKDTRAGITEETTYRVVVRRDRVAAVVCDGKLMLLAEPAAAALGPWPAMLPGISGAHDVDGMFQHIADQLRADESLSRRTYATMNIDRRDGHPTRYVRRTRGGAERLEWTVKLTRDDIDATTTARPR